MLLRGARQEKTGPSLAGGHKVKEELPSDSHGGTAQDLYDSELSGALRLKVSARVQEAYLPCLLLRLQSLEQSS